MKPLYTQIEFEKAKGGDKLSLECYNCKKEFKYEKKYIKLTLKKHVSSKGMKYEFSCRYCSKKCQINSMSKKQLVCCKNCKVEFLKTTAEIKKNKNHFCSQSCSGTYNNTHKTHGTRRSRLEIYLEEQLILLYPNLKIDFNKKNIINSELDIYIPSLKLAFEINGIFHYKPIFGFKKLIKIQNNDQLKLLACLNNNIELTEINTSNFNYFKPETANKFLNIITEKINKKLSNLTFQ